MLNRFMVVRFQIGALSIPQYRLAVMPNPLNFKSRIEVVLQWIQLSFTNRVHFFTKYFSHNFNLSRVLIAKYVKEFLASECSVLYMLKAMCTPINRNKLNQPLTHFKRLEIQSLRLPGLRLPVCGLKRPKHQLDWADKN